MWDARAARARQLAERYSSSREILLFYSGLAEWQGRAAAAAPSTLERVSEQLPSLRALVVDLGPAPLADAARALDPERWPETLAEYWEGRASETPLDFFARAALQPYAASLPAEQPCPWCAAAPQVGALREQGEGRALELVCALCLRRRAAERGRCAGCGETNEAKLFTFTTPDLAHFALAACESCRGYLPLVDLSKEPRAIPEVDELAALPLDLRAHEQGYRKLQPNLAGV